MNIPGFGGRKTQITMVNSVDDYAAGKTYTLEPQLADSFILKGYATGELSRDYTEDEQAALRSNMQTVAV